MLQCVSCLADQTLCSTGEVQAFYDDLNGRVFINEVFKFSVDKMHSLLFTESQFMRDFLEQRRFSGTVSMTEHTVCWSNTKRSFVKHSN